MRALGLVAACALALVVVVAPVALAGMPGAGLTSGGSSGVLPGVSIPTNATICLDYPACTKTISYDGTNTNVIGALLATGTIRTNSQYLNPNGGVSLAFGQDFTNATDPEGNVSDSAGNSAIGFGNATALTAGMDRYIGTFYSNGWSTARSRVATNGTYINLATVGTAAIGTGITAVYSGADPYWLHKVTVINTALAAAATSDVTLAVTPVNSRIVRVTADVTQVFTGGSLSAMTVGCGNSAGGVQYLLANSVFTAQNTWGDVQAEMGVALIGATSANVADFGTSAAGVPGAITVQCRFTCTGANCSAATQGSVTFYVEGVTYF